MGLSRHKSHQRLGKTCLHGLAFGQALAQVGAQAAQGGDSGDNAGLFGEGWQSKLCVGNVFATNSRNSDANRLCLEIMSHCLQEDHQKFRIQKNRSNSHQLPTYGHFIVLHYV